MMQAERAHDFVESFVAKVMRQQKLLVIPNRSARKLAVGIGTELDFTQTAPGSLV